MNRRLFLAALLAVTACGRGDTAAYRAPDGSFSASLPGRWKADETRRGARLAAFYGPPDGAKPFSQSIVVSFEPAGGRWPSASAYVALAGATMSGPPRPQPPPRATETSFERAVPSIHGGPARESVRVVAVEVAGGFYVLEHAWPLDASPAPEFDAFRASFQPASK